mgnify:CR=1 FL=1
MTHAALIAAFPPPVAGQSLAAKLLKDGLDANGFDTIPIDLAEPVGGSPVPRRLLHLAAAEVCLLRACLRHPDLIVYLQLGHGKRALLRDMVFMATAAAARRPCIAHVHGSGMRSALDGLPAPIRHAEIALIRRLRAAVVLGNSLRDMFSGILPDDRVVVVDNGIDPDFVRCAQSAVRRHENTPMRVLFLSNFLSIKGYGLSLIHI